LPVLPCYNDAGQLRYFGVMSGQAHSTKRAADPAEDCPALSRFWVDRLLVALAAAALLVPTNSFHLRVGKSGGEPQRFHIYRPASHRSCVASSSSKSNLETLHKIRASTVEPL